MCIEVIATLGDEVLVPRFRCTPDTDAVPARRLASWRARSPQSTPTTPASTSAAPGRRRPRRAAHLRPRPSRRADHRRGRAVVHDRVRPRLAAHRLDDADRRARLAEGVLETLARFQGGEVNDETEEEPGKILHEMRFGAAARAALGSGEVYYGSIDATPLFVMLLGELRRWDLADDVVDRLLPHADRALDWIESSATATATATWSTPAPPTGARQPGLEGLLGRDPLRGRALAAAPIALCEVQGYVYAAYLARAHFAREAGDEETFTRYVDKAQPSSSGSTRTSGSTSTAGTRSASTPTSSRSTRSPPTWATASGPASSTRRRRGGGQAADVARDVLGLGHSHARHEHDRVQPGELPQRVGVAPRQRDLSPPDSCATASSTKRNA